MKPVVLWMACLGLFCLGTAACAETIHVWTNSAVNGLGTAWSNAYWTIQGGVDAATNAGDVVLVTNGVYELGGAVTPGHSLSNRVCITSAITVESVNGPSSTFIVGASHGGTNGPTAVRCVYLTDDSALVGFTLTNGHTRTSGHSELEQSGGGVFLSNGGLVSRCRIIGNSAPNGGGVSIFSDGILENCLLSGNTAVSDGGAVYCNGAGTLRNCTLSDNSAGSEGSGVWNYEGDTIRNCIVYGNTPGGTGNIHDERLDAPMEVLYTCSPGLSGSGNITNNPQFIDAASGDYRLLTNSPCIDAGTNAYAHGSTDLDGNPRISNRTVDMGAYESPGSAPVAGFSGCLDLDGADDYVRIADHDALDMTNNYTLECWFRADQLGWLRGLIGKYHGVEGSGQSKGYLLRLYDTELDFDGGFSSGLGLKTGVWYHTAAVNAGGARTLYVNGAPVPIGSASYTVETNAAPLTIGVDYLASPRYLDGRMDEVRIWNTALSADAISNWMYREVDATHPSYANLVAYYKLNDGSGAVAADAVGTHDGTLSNMTEAAWIDSDVPGGYTLRPGETATGRLVGSDVDGASSNGYDWALSFEIVQQGVLGTATVVTDNVFSYTVNAEVGGHDQFTYRVRDDTGSTSNVETVSIMVHGLHAGNSPVHYAWTNSPSQAWPFTNWVTAAHTIQQAVDAANSNDTVSVTNGVYDMSGAATPAYSLTNRVCITRTITVQSTSGPDSAFIVGSGPIGDSAIRCLYVNTNATVNGFTFTNGHTMAGDDPHWQNKSGAGVCLDGAGSISNCVIAGCSAGGSGGGLYAVGDAGGPRAETAGQTRNLRIMGCSAGTDGGGAHLVNGGALRTGLVLDNTAGADGGGIYAEVGGRVYNCTVVGNSAADGGGVSVFFDANIINNIIYFNSAPTNANLTPWAAANPAYCCLAPNPGGAGNITNDPQFVNAANSDYRLQGTSPCVDAGNNSHMPSGPGLDGVPRPLDGKNDGTNTVDMGCYEYLHRAADSDGDTMTDGFEDEYGLDPTDPADATGNLDNDPHNNREEFIADTDPTNPASYFCISNISVSSPVTVYFESSSNRFYTMNYCSNLFDAAWTNVPGAGPEQGEGGPDFLGDTNEPAKGPFYRLEVELPGGG